MSVVLLLLLTWLKRTNFPPQGTDSEGGEGNDEYRRLFWREHIQNYRSETVHVTSRRHDEDDHSHYDFSRAAFHMDTLLLASLID